MHVDHTGQLELHLPIDAGEEPFAYPGPEGCLALEVALSGGGHARLVLPTEEAREWAGEAFAAVSTAYRELTGDPYALSEEELAALPPPSAYFPRPGLHLYAEDGHPAVMRFHIALDVAGQCLAEGALRAALAQGLTEGFNLARLGIGAAVAVSGSAN